MNKIFLFSLALLLWACANRVAPSGGPKDEDPPQIIKSTPENGEKNVDIKTLTLTFNEFVTVKGIKEQLIITPRIDFDYKYKIKKRTIHFEFEEQLNDSTTYTFNFRDGIVDITESNPADQLVIAFSTGPLLDTLQIIGQIIDLMTGQPIGKAVVGLYEETDTTDLFSKEPLYFTNTLKDGSFTFRNIKDGNYRIYAFLDNNKNLICESDREAYGFYKELIRLDSNINLEPIQVQHLNIDSLKVNRVQQSGHYFNLTANKFITNADLKAEDGQKVQFSYSEDHKVLKIYNTLDIFDSLLIRAQLQDSTGTELSYEFYIRFEETTRRKDGFKANLIDLIGSVQHKKITGTFIFDKPVDQINLDSMRIVRDTTMFILVKDLIRLRPDSTRTNFYFTMPFPQAMLDSITQTATGAKAKLAKRNAGKQSKGSGAYEFVVPQGTFYSVEKDTTEQITKSISLLLPTQMGIIQGSIQSSYPAYEIQLVNVKYEVIKTAEPATAYKFTEIKPGEYLIRILIDSNQNGKWDPGDIRRGLLPEPVIIYSDPNGVQKTSIRANWEMTLDLTF
jgi:uncharacterized protein (DUF2141 family)